MTVGEKIKQRRIELGLSQDELAKKVGYKSRSSINKIELARDLPLKKIKKMAEVLDLPISYLMDWTDSNGIAPDLAENNEPYVGVEDEEELKSFAIMIAYLKQLNDEGFEEALKRIEELTQLDKYKKDDTE